jgi:hypothetical protein
MVRARACARARAAGDILARSSLYFLAIVLLLAQCDEVLVM